MHNTFLYFCQCFEKVQSVVKCLHELDALQHANPQEGEVRAA